MIKKKILFVLPWESSGAAGIEQYALLLAKHIQNPNLDFLFVALVADGTAREKIESCFPEGVRVEVVHAPRARNSIGKLRLILLKESPDLIVGASPHISTLVLLSKWSVLSRVPVIAMNQGFDPENRLLRMHVWFSSWFSQAVVPVSHGLVDMIVDICPVAKKKIDVIYNPFSLETVRQKAQSDPMRFTDGIYHVIYVGRLEEGQKSITTLLRVMKQLDETHPGTYRLRLIGDGPDKFHYMEWVNKNDLGRVILFEGWQDNPYGFIAASDVLVLPSRFEGFGRVLVEAMALGVQVVSTDCPSGPNEILKKDEYGALVSIGDAEAMAAAIVATVQHPIDPDKLRARAEDFDVSRIALRFEHVLKKTLL
jgi:glycosyltransferase involved in cell wall biosynthesis